MASRTKRQADEDASTTSSTTTQRPNKRARQRELKKVAHRIPTQSNQGNESKVKKVVQLPGQIQVDRYVEAFSYEIKALQNAIKGSSVGSSIRAWQMLPRHLRRRNASHSLLALPKRLREKGRAELKASSTISRSRADTRRRKGKGDRSALGAYPRRKETSRRKELVGRASKSAISGQAWMETHLWHAKRFRMSALTAKKIGGKMTPLPDRWGFTLAEESTMKSHRSTWRDQKKHLTLMDSSYNAWIRVSVSVGTDKDDSKLSQMASKLLRVAGCTDGWQEGWWDGKHCCYTIFSRTPSNSSDDDKDDVSKCSACGPVQILWLQSDRQPSPNERKKVEILLSTHPAAASSLQRSLRLALVFISREIDAKVKIDRLNSLPHPFITVGHGSIGRRHTEHAEGVKPRPQIANIIDNALQKRWMRSEAYNTFQLNGKESGRLLNRALRPINKEDICKMEAVRTGAAVDGLVIPLEVHDPRLSFPPTRPTRKVQKDVTMKEAKASLEMSWSASSRLLNHGCSLPSFRKGEIDRRRSKLITPGSRLLPTSQDDVIPIVIIAAQKGETGYTVMVPRGWGQAFWLSLVYPGTRVIGQVQSHALTFNAGKPFFPADWVGTSPFHQHEDAESLIAFEEWSRKPPAKRPNFEKTGVRWPFGGLGLWKEIVHRGRLISKVDQVRDNKERRLPWLFNPFMGTSIDDLVLLYRQWIVDRSDQAQTILSILGSAIICVKVTVCRRGAFNQWDEIHLISKEDTERWKIALQDLQLDGHDKSKVQRQEMSTSPSSKTHIGSITTSNFNLSNGKVSALASISLLTFLDIKSAQSLTHPSNEKIVSRNPIPIDNLILVKNAQSGAHRVASLQIAPLI